MDQTFHNLFLFSLILALILMLILFLIYHTRRSNKLKRALEAQAIKRNGTLTGGFLVSYPKLSFSHNTNEVAVYSVPGGRYTPPYTHVSVKLPIPINQKIRIYNEKITGKIGKALGMQDIQIDSDSFDNQFMIKGTDEYYVRNLLTFNIQDMILSISKYKPLILINNQTLKISVPDVITDDYAYDQLINTTLKIIDRIKEIKLY